MISVLYYLLLVWGLTWTATSGVPVSPLRILLLRVFGRAAYGVYCNGCVGYWVGIALALAGRYPFPLHGFADYVLAGFVGTGTALALNIVLPNSSFEVETRVAGVPFDEDLKS